MSETAPFRHPVTPGGFHMSVAMTPCGAPGWVADRGRYRYDPVDPESGRRWPALPDAMGTLADVVVWGGASCLRFHGVRPLKDREHPFAGARRINITFRKVFA